MADSLDTVAVIAAGLTTLGVVLDWGVRPETKQRIQTKLESLLYRFRYTSLRTFGRDEIEFSMRVFDLFGRRFLSWRRLLFVVAFYAGLVALATVSMSMERAPRPDELAYLIISAVLFSASISFAIWACNVVLRLPGGTTVWGTLALLFVHLLLLSMWQPLVSTTTNALAGPISKASLDWPIFVNWWRVVESIPAQRLEAFAEGFAHGIAVSLPDAPRWFFRSNTNIWWNWCISIDKAAALFSNGLRIALALVFLAGFIYVRCVRPVLIWFWSALTRSNALFSPPASALAAVIIAIDKRDAIIGALTRPFQ